MIIPSIDIQGGRAVQLRNGRELVMDCGDPLEILSRFALAGEVAVIDLDAAMGVGSNAPLIREMCARASCRIGGGIRSIESAREWLDSGARKVILGTAATEENCAALPRDRVIAALDADAEEVVVDGWRRRTGERVLERIDALAPYVSGFLVTQVDREGCLAGFDMEMVQRVVTQAGDARVTTAGGVTTAEEIAVLDRLGVDAQVGLALYRGILPLGVAVAAPLGGDPSGLWPTVVCDESGRAMGLAWSSRESIALAVTERRGVYWSRSRRTIWRKGESSGATQELLRIDLDCDRDALRFTVRQHATGFCHQGTWGCWPEIFGLETLARALGSRVAEGTHASGTARLAADPELLRAKLHEEAEELSTAEGGDALIHEAADLLYFTLTALVSRGGGVNEMMDELERRSRRVRRRPMDIKEANR